MPVRVWERRGRAASGGNVGDSIKFKKIKNKKNKSCYTCLPSVASTLYRINFILLHHTFFLQCKLFSSGLFTVY